MSTLLEQAKEWRRVFEKDIPPTRENIVQGYALIEEESRELDASFSAILPHLSFRIVPPCGNIAELAKEMGDVVFVLYQFAALLGIDLDEVMRLIYESNMTKLDENGKPIFDENKKVMKGPNYQKPDLTKIALASSSKISSVLPCNPM